MTVISEIFFFSVEQLILEIIPLQSRSNVIFTVYNIIKKLTYDS